MNSEPNKRVLILDDDRALLRSLQLLLEARGYSVTAYRNPLRGCHWVKQLARLPKDRLPDVVIVDYAMPLMDGAEVLRSVRKWLGAACFVLLISAHTDQVRGLDLEALGIDAFLEKPLDLDRLQAIIEKGRAA